MDEMGGGTEIVGQIGVGFDCGEGCRSAAIAVFADQCVDDLVFAKILYAGGENDEVGAVGQRHAGAIDGLVAEPGGVKLAGVEIDNGLFEGCVEDFKVDLEAKVGGEVKTLGIIADEETAHGEAAFRAECDDG